MATAVLYSALVGCIGFTANAQDAICWTRFYIYQWSYCVRQEWYSSYLQDYLRGTWSHAYSLYVAAVTQSQEYWAKIWRLMEMWHFNLTPSLGYWVRNGKWTCSKYMKKETQGSKINFCDTPPLLALCIKITVSVCLILHIITMAGQYIFIYWMIDSADL